MNQLTVLKKILCAVTLSSVCNFALSQDYNEYIHSKEGRELVTRHNLVTACVLNYGASTGNREVTKVCECQVDLLERRYDNKQIKNYRKKYGENALPHLIKDDTLLQQQIRDCSKNSNVALYNNPAYRQSFVTKCIENIKTSSGKPVNDSLAGLFCNCAADIMEQRKITIEKMGELSDPSSLLYNEIAYKCGSPFLAASDVAKDWKASNSNDIVGPPVDSVPVVSIMGIHKIKIQIGSEIRVWMIDSGASDLLVSDAFAQTLKAKGFLSEAGFIGEGRYSLADNSIILCRRYKIDSIKVGNMIVNNVILASSKDAEVFLAGKSLLNKFSQWSIDNKNNFLILKR